ncbi:SDR family oxidoreductase [Jannaschia sp. R86511]|uniref:SDR family oxidoreductase n=1 Tax=Jannaschia sp. R86511 TaxID=3093853 RepID=UPI0036D3CA16
MAGARVIVTGGSSGIGRALARAMADEGATVVITGRDRERLHEAARNHQSIRTVVCDVTDAEQIEALHDQVLASGGVDILVNCAGVMHFFDVTSGFPLQRQLQEIDIDVAGPVRLVHAFLPHLLQRRSVIVNVSSGLAWVPYASAPVYSGAKAFVHAWTVALREQLKGTSVRVVELLPPVTDTPLADGLNPSFARMPTDDLVQAFLQGLRRGQDEIAPGQSVQLKWLSRLAPGLIFARLNATSRPSAVHASKEHYE